MLRFYYQWRYNRAQRVSSFEVPRGTRSTRINLGSYLSQDTVRGRHFDRFDLPRKRGRCAKLVVSLLILMLIAWVIYESFKALSVIAKG